MSVLEYTATARPTSQLITLSRMLEINKQEKTVVPRDSVRPTAYRYVLCIIVGVFINYVYIV